jgi:hypothetical protein
MQEQQLQAAAAAAVTSRDATETATVNSSIATSVIGEAAGGVGLDAEATAVSVKILSRPQPTVRAPNPYTFDNNGVYACE